jgi:hypothetical protein
MSSLGARMIKAAEEALAYAEGTARATNQLTVSASSARRVRRTPLLCASSSPSIFLPIALVSRRPLLDPEREG